MFLLYRFGEDVTVLHPLEHPFSSRDGGHILQNLTFSQSKTNFSMVRKFVASYPAVSKKKDLGTRLVNLLHKEIW